MNEETNRSNATNSHTNNLTCTGGSIIPMALLDAVMRQRFFDEAAALEAKLVRRAPSYMDERIQWARMVARAAWSDREALVKIPLDGGPLTLNEVDSLGPLVEHLHVLHLRWRDTRTTGSTAAAGSAASGELDRQGAEQRELQKKLLAAFDLRFKNNADGRALLRDIRKGAGDADLLSDNVRLLRLCNAAEHRDWLASMPKGEAAAAARITKLHAEFAKLLHDNPYDPATLKDLLDRAWTLFAGLCARVLDAGRYLVSDHPARKSDYAAFRPPAPSRKTSKKRRKQPEAAAPTTAPAKPPADPQ